MDDFLHNLRSGKLKQTDRGRRDYSDYKGPQRRATNERRKTDYYAKVTNENFALIKETLDVLADCQKRIADAVVERGEAQDRIANALETIAQMMSNRSGGMDSVSQSDAPLNTDHEELIDMLPSTASESDGKDVHSITPPDLIGIIATMRGQGDSWEKIARYFDDQNIPTVSGKGKWRGPAIKKYWLTNA
jgi:hypothetical protein